MRAMHSHAHAHHHHAPARDGKGAIFAFAFGINLAFVLIETAFGAIGHSMALFADAGHNFGDTMGLGAAWIANALARRQPTGRFTYGLRGSSILAALLNAIVLLIAVGAIVAEAIQRLIYPAPVSGDIVIAVALLGIALNGSTALILSRAGRGDLNVSSALTHALGDAGVSFGVALSGALVLATGWAWLDPATSLAIAAIIVVATWSLLRRALAMALHAVPHAIDPQAVRDHLARLPGVAAVHDLHIWPMSTTETALTAHLVMPQGHPGDAALATFAGELDRRFSIAHVTIQVETGAQECALEPDHVV